MLTKIITDNDGTKRYTKVFFEVPYFNSSLTGEGIIIAQLNDLTYRVKVTAGNLKGHDTDISTIFITEYQNIIDCTHVEM